MVVLNLIRLVMALFIMVTGAAVALTGIVLLVIPPLGMIVISAGATLFALGGALAGGTE